MKGVKCPQEKNHTKQPEGYIQWHDWAEKKQKVGYRQKKCLGCGHYQIWYKKLSAPTR